MTSSVYRHPGQPVHNDIMKKPCEHSPLPPATNKNNDPFLHRLPVELVSEIFEHALPFPPSLQIFDSDFYEKGHIQAVNALAHVCQNWCNIARSTPGLWTVISIDLGQKAGIKNSVHLAYQWLALSKALPLFLRLYQSDSRFKDPYTTAKLIPLIAIHAHRWKVLELCKLSQPVVNLLSLTLSVDRLDRLEHLKLSLLENHPIKSTPLRLKASPLLLTAQWCSLPKISIGWERLSQFISTEGQDLSVREFIYLLENAPSLRYCRIARVLPTEAPPKKVVQHAYLETLVIGYCRWEMWELFMLPALKTLNIGCAPDEQGWVSIRDFLGRSGSPITDLSLYTTGRAHLDYQDWPTEIPDVLRDIPCLEKLSIHGDGLKESLLSFLADSCMVTTSDDSELLPNLKSFTMSYMSAPLSFNWPGVVDFLKAMTSRPERSLQSVEIHFTRVLLSGQDLTMDKTILKEVMAVAQGLDFKILTRNGTDLVEQFRHNLDS